MTQDLVPRLRRAIDSTLDRMSIVDPRPDPVIASEFGAIYDRCREFSLASVERLYAVYKSVRYVLDAGLSGDLVECGVWKGGSAMAMALTLLDRGVNDRSIYLYDTFEGMTAPTAVDEEAAGGQPAMPRWAQSQRPGGSNWDYSPLDEVRRNLNSTGYPAEKLVFVKGPVEETVPRTIPRRIAILRLDTDWYVPTKHELEHLYPLLEPRGVLIVDDYGHWKGARKAVDEYFATRPILLNRLDYTGRIAIKT